FHAAPERPFSRGLVEKLGLDQAIGLLPEANLGGVLPEPAVAHDAMLGRQSTGQERGLYGAGDGGHDLAQPAGPAIGGETLQVRRVPEIAGRQTDRVQHDERTHRGESWSGILPIFLLNLCTKALTVKAILVVI